MGRPRARAAACAEAAPTTRHPARPGPRVTAIASTASQPPSTPASAASTTGASISRWARAASSGTTPPWGACRAICFDTWLERISRPSRTTAAAVSSHEVSMARMFTLRTPSGGAARPSEKRGSPHATCRIWSGRRSRAWVFGGGRRPHAHDVDALEDVDEVALECGRMQRVAPHHDRVLAVVGVVAAPPADRLEAEALVEPDGVPVAHPHLHGYPARPELARRAALAEQ